MSTPAQTASPTDTAADAAAVCIENQLGSLVVVEDDDIVGIVTSTDLIQVLARAANPRTQPIREFMSSPVVTIESSEPVGTAMDEMLESDVSRLVVVHNGEFVGLVSTNDILHYVPQVYHRHQFKSPTTEEYHYRVRRETSYERDDWEFECMCRSDEAISVGDRVRFTKPISDHDIRAFAEASGDTNRLHLDEEFAKETRFGKRIGHGTLIGGLISAALARLPGLTIYLTQDLTFLSPVSVGERVTAICEVIESIGERKYALTTDVFGEDGEQIIEGEAVVLIDELLHPEQTEFEALP